MKNIIILVFLIVSFTSNAQTNYTPAGTWRWTSGTDTIIIFFKSQILTLENNTTPLILGFHKYIKNGITIESRLSSSNSSFNDHLYSIIMYNGRPHIAKQQGTFKDLTLGNERMIFTEKINSTTIKVVLEYIHGVRNNRPYGFTLPRNFILTKQ
jgi:hypothetical protein